MRKSIKFALLSGVAIVGLMLGVRAQPAEALLNSTQAGQQACAGLDLGSGTGTGSSGDTSSGSCSSGGGASGLQSLAADVINILSLIVGVAAIIMVIIGGLRFVISAGDSSGVSSARSTIIYALVGLLIAALAQVLVHFVLERAATPSNSSSSSSSSSSDSKSKSGSG